jgi:hypothetical protein
MSFDRAPLTTNHLPRLYQLVMLNRFMCYGRPVITTSLNLTNPRSLKKKGKLSSPCCRFPILLIFFPVIRPVNPEYR